MDTYADDLAGLLNMLDVKDAMLGKRAVDGVPCALPCAMRQAMFGFSRQGSKAS